MKYVASCSGGKDSVATIILAWLNNEPLDEIIFVEVMFDKEISGELPEHIDFINNTLKPWCEDKGYKFTILRAEKTYLDMFYHQIIKGVRKGKLYGFPMMGKCFINCTCKMRPIKEFNKQNQDAVNYVGIAIDEPKRLERLGEGKISLLAKYGYTEAMARKLCEQYGLLSPIYKFTKRGGCWFCPNCRIAELKHLRNNHRELWDKLLELEEVPNTVGNIWNILTKTSIHDWEKHFDLEDRQITIFDLMENNNEQTKNNL